MSKIPNNPIGKKKSLPIKEVFGRVGGGDGEGNLSTFPDDCDSCVSDYTREELDDLAYRYGVDPTGFENQKGLCEALMRVGPDYRPSCGEKVETSFQLSTSSGFVRVENPPASPKFPAKLRSGGSFPPNKVECERYSRLELDELADDNGLDPETFKRKADLCEALLKIPQTQVKGIERAERKTKLSPRTGGKNLGISETKVFSPRQMSSATKSKLSPKVASKLSPRAGGGLSKPTLSTKASPVRAVPVKTSPRTKASSVRTGGAKPCPGAPNLECPETTRECTHTPGKEGFASKREMAGRPSLLEIASALGIDTEKLKKPSPTGKMTLKKHDLCGAIMKKIYSMEPASGIKRSESKTPRSPVRKAGGPNEVQPVRKGGASEDFPPSKSACMKRPGKGGWGRVKQSGEHPSLDQIAAYLGISSVENCSKSELCSSIEKALRDAPEMKDGDPRGVAPKAKVAANQKIVDRLFSEWRGLSQAGEDRFRYRAIRDATFVIAGMDRQLTDPEAIRGIPTCSGKSIGEGVVNRISDILAGRKSTPAGEAEDEEDDEEAEESEESSEEEAEDEESSEEDE